MMDRPQTASPHDDQLAAHLIGNARDLLGWISYSLVQAMTAPRDMKQRTRVARCLLRLPATPRLQHVVMRWREGFQHAQGGPHMHQVEFHIAEPLLPSQQLRHGVRRLDRAIEGQQNAYAAAKSLGEPRVR